MKNDGIITLKNFSSFPEVVHGFAAQEFIPENKIVMAEQIHGSKVELIENNNGLSKIKGVDGLITPKPDIFLMIHTADCLPILFYDPERKIIAACHAGWRGTLQEVTGQTLMAMERQGSRMKKIMVGIGPHIKICCYSVPAERIQSFEEKFGPDKKIFRKSDHQFYLDLTYLNLKQLQGLGIPKENIEVAPYCTFCSSRKLPSYRRQGKAAHPGLLGIIGRIN